MATNESNLIAGPLQVYIGPLSEPVPELDNIEPPGITVTPAGNWVQVGFTVEDFETEYTPTWEGVDVNEACADVESHLVKEEGSIAFTLQEQDLTMYNTAMAASNLTSVAAGADQTAQDILTVGSDTSNPKKSLLVLGSNPEGGSRVMHVYKAQSEDASTFTRGRKLTGTAVKFKFFADTTQSVGEQLFNITDITAAASS